MKRTCPACGQEAEVKTKDITEECTLEWEIATDGKVMIAIKDGSKTVAIIGLGGYAIVYNKFYEFKKVYESAECGWWFRVMRVL